MPRYVQQISNHKENKKKEKERILTRPGKYKIEDLQKAKKILTRGGENARYTE